MGALSSAAPALLDLSGRAMLRLTGADRVRYLNGQVSNDVRRATLEQSVYACVMTIKGKMCADVFIRAIPDGLLADTESELRETLLTRLGRYIVADDVELDDVTDATALLHRLHPGLPFDAPADPLPASVTEAFAALSEDRPGAIVVTRSRRFGPEGWDVFCPATLRASVHQALLPHGRELSALALEPLRIAAGVARWGCELDENTMPAEAGMEARAVDFGKGCYIGQEIVSRIKSVGHVNRQLRGLLATDGGELAAGMTLRHGSGVADALASAREAGRITSAAYDPRRGAFIALGYIRRGWETPGTRLQAAAPPGTDAPSPVATCTVEVCAFPF